MTSLYLYGTEYRQHADGYYYSTDTADSRLHRLYHRARTIFDLFSLSLSI